MAKIVVLQYLRAAAALAVVFFHVFAWDFRASGGAPALVHLGQFGVDVFFVISGYVMWTTVAAAPATRPGAFFLRRLIRIVPLYWAATLAAALVNTDEGLAFGYRGDVADLLTSLLFIPAPAPGRPEIVAPILTVGWTLNLEMLFYGLFALCLFLNPERRLAGLALALAGLVAAGVLFSVTNAHAPTILAAWTQSIVIEFLMGAGLGAFHAAQGRRDEPLGVGLFMILLGIGAAFAASLAGGGLPEWRGFVWGPPALLVVAGALALEGAARRREWALLVLLGDASYALYLTHGMWCALARALLPDGAPTPVLQSAEIFGAVAVAVLVHLFFEQPAGRALKRLVGQPRDARAIPSRAPLVAT